MKRPTRRDVTIAGVVAGLVVMLGLLGADKPPPAGFFVVVAMAMVLGVLIAFALPRWRAVKGLPECKRVQGPAGQGALAALAMWLVLVAVGGEPTIEMTTADYLVSGALAASIGAAGASILAWMA